MTKRSDLFSDELFDQMLAEGYIRINRHPVEAGLILLNYSEKTQYEKIWNDCTEQCRGLILDNEGLVVARPYRKFWNWAEKPSLISDWEQVQIVDKMDGSLGIAYYHLGEDDELHLAVATRGSFSSDQAKWATSWLRNTYPKWLPTARITPLFEILVDWNRIVLDYGDRFNALEDVPQRSARDDQGQHLRQAQDRLGTVPCLSCGGATSGPAEAWRLPASQHPVLARRESGTLPGVGGSARQADSGRDVGVEEGTLHRLSSDVSPGFYGLGSRPGREAHQRLAGAQHEGRTGGDREVRACVCELSPRSNVPTGRGLLVLLGGVNMDSGDVLGPHEARVTLSWPGEIAEILPYTNFAKFRDSEAAQRVNREGVVVRCGNKMIKWKQGDYVELHRLVTGLTNRRVWEALSEGRVGDLAGLPDEFHAWARAVGDELVQQTIDWKRDVVEEFEALNAPWRGPAPTRKEFAELVQGHPYRAAMFKMLDGQSIDAMAWAHVRPVEITKPYGGMADV